MRQLHNHQLRAIEMLRQSLATGHRRPMLQAPTGSGKTILAAAIVRSALDKGNRVAFCVPAISLIDQTVEKFGQEGIGDLGVIQADHPLTNEWAPVQVCSVQTLARRRLPATDLVIVDEAHLAHKTIFQWMVDQPELRFVGLSATPWSRGLGRHYDDLVVPTSLRKLIDEGLLAPFRVYAPSHPDLSGVRTMAGDYHEGDLAEAMAVPQITADVVRTWMQLGENRPTLCFAVNRAHAHKLMEEFLAAGIEAAYVDAYTEREERNVIGAAFAAGRIKVVCNCATLTTGIDWPVECIVLARPTQSEILYTQIIGRGLRTARGKADCMILDHSDSTLNLGFVDQIRHDRLDDGSVHNAGARQRREPKLALPKECPSCHLLKPAGVHVCPGCGFAPMRQPDIEVVDGRLQLVAGDAKPADRATKQRFWSGLLWYCDQRGYKGGWAANKYREKFGVWPRGLIDRAAPPGSEVRNFVKAGQIRWAKSRERQVREAANA